MGMVRYNGQALSVPEILNGKRLRDIFGVPKDRTMYSINNQGKSRVIGDDDRVETGQIQNLGDVPQTQKG